MENHMTQAILPQIKKIVFLMLENRSLDNVLGWLYQGENPKHVFPTGSAPEFDGLKPGAFSNPRRDSNGVVQRHTVQPLPDDLDSYNDCVPWHDPYEEMNTDSWKGVMNQLYGNQDVIGGMPTPASGPARMEGFWQDYYVDSMTSWYGHDILWTYTPAHLPVINGLAKNYAVCDRWFCSAPTQTNPNRAFSLCGTSLGREKNLHFDAAEQFDVPTVFNYLKQAGKTCGIFYASYWHSLSSYTEYTFPQISAALSEGSAGMDAFYARAEAGTLPDFTYIEPKWGYGQNALVILQQGNDYHPPTQLGPGEQFLCDVYQALSQGKGWAETLLVVTFDEHGGTFDHVPPPWGAINPEDTPGDYGFNFDLYGVRVPTILISPFIKPSTVFRAPTGSAQPFDHTSFIKTLLLWAGVDIASVKLGKRMPHAPTFEGVFESTPVNVAYPEIQPKDVPAPVAGVLDGMSIPAAKTVVLRNLGKPAGLQADIQRYRDDPAKFEAEIMASLQSST
jgi:phospholipase C